jgi:hypothetical protein
VAHRRAVGNRGRDEVHERARGEARDRLVEAPLLVAAQRAHRRDALRLRQAIEERGQRGQTDGMLVDEGVELGLGRG